jgi:SOS-response transcriptional repressor LexA
MGRGDLMAAQGAERRQAILAFIVGFKTVHRYPPTVRQIADGVGLVSLGAVHGHLHRLVREGRLVHRQISESRFIYDLPDAEAERLGAA